MAATKTLHKNKNVALIYDFFKQFKTWCGQSPVTPTGEELEKYLAHDFEMFNNGQQVVKGGRNYLNRLQKFQKKYSNFQISEPLEEPIASENQAALYYKIDLTTRDGQHRQVYIMGLLTTENNKIKRWVEVTNDKASGNWDA